MKKCLVIAILVLATVTLSACTQSDNSKKNNVTSTAPTTNEVQEIAQETTSTEDEFLEQNTDAKPSTSSEKTKENTSEVAKNTTPSTTKVTPEEGTTKEKVFVSTTSKPETIEQKVEVEPTIEVSIESKIDIDYYISYAKNYAQSIGLGYDNSATECWDNPISVTSGTTSTIANIESRLNRYKNLEGFECICIWYEKVGENNYEIYIGYA